MHDRDRQVPSFSHGKIREYEGGSMMKNPKSFTTFLEGFNLGAILALISRGGALLNQSDRTSDISFDPNFNRNEWYRCWSGSAVFINSIDFNKKHDSVI